jgi:NADH-ubiquinone oxidoreductase chain 2
MLALAIFSLITAVRLPSVKISPLLLTRVTSIILLYAGVLSFNCMYIQAIGSGIGIYSGLFQVTPVSEFIDAFIVVIGAIILIGWAPVTSKVEDKVDSESTALPIISEYPLLILFTVSGASFLISRRDLVSMYLSIELQSFAVYILASLYRESESATSAGLKYFLLGGLSSGLILLGSALVYAYTGLTDLESIFSLLSVDNVNNLRLGLGPVIIGLVITRIDFYSK